MEQPTTSSTLIPLAPRVEQRLMRLRATHHINRPTLLERRVYRSAELLGLRYVAQMSFPPYRVDLFLPAWGIVLEVDGCAAHGCPAHTSPAFAQAQARKRAQRDARLLEKHGVLTLHLLGHDLQTEEAAYEAVVVALTPFCPLEFALPGADDPDAGDHHHTTGGTRMKHHTDTTEQPTAAAPRDPTAEALVAIEQQLREKLFASGDPLVVDEVGEALADFHRAHAARLAAIQRSPAVRADEVGEEPAALIARFLVEQAQAEAEALVRRTQARAAQRLTLAKNAWQGYREAARRNAHWQRLYSQRQERGGGEAR